MNVVHAFQQGTGSRNLGITRVQKRLLAWEKDKQCRIDIIYVPTKLNLADKPSRVIHEDEVGVSNRFLNQVENDFGMTVTFDACSHGGFRLKNRLGSVLPYCSRYVDQNNHYVNFLSKYLVS